MTRGQVLQLLKFWDNEGTASGGHAAILFEILNPKGGPLDLDEEVWFDDHSGLVRAVKK